jgi:hypothetical protein
MRGAGWSLRSRWSNHRSYLAYSQRRHPMGVITRDTQIVIDSFPRSANTFVTVAFQISQPYPVRIAHHLHAPAQIIAGARMGIPMLVPVRDPRAAAISLIIRSPHISLEQALRAHARFHERVLPYRAACHVALFDEVTSDLGRVIENLNARFGSTFTPFDHTPENVARVYALIDERARDPIYTHAIRAHRSGLISDAELSAARGGQSRIDTDRLSERRVARPSAERRALSEAANELYEAPKLARLRDRAESAYRRFAFGS